MIDNLFIHNCTLQRKRTYSDDSGYDGTAASSEYYDISVGEKCLVRFDIPHTKTGSEAGTSEVVTGTVRIKTEMLITDRILYDGNFYKVGNVIAARDFLTEEIEYYTAEIEKERVGITSTLAII